MRTYWRNWIPALIGVCVLVGLGAGSLPVGRVGVASAISLEGTPTPLGECADRFEPDGVLSDAHPLLLNDTPQKHSFCPAGDADWVSMTLSRAKHYVIRTLVPNGGPFPSVDPYINLFDPDGHQVLVSDDDSGGGLQARIDFVPNLDGVYWLQMKNKGDLGGVTAFYGVSLTVDNSPLATGTPTPTIPPTSVLPPPAKPSVIGTATPFLTPTSIPTIPTPTVLRVLHPGEGLTGGIPWLAAGPEGATASDWLEPDNTIKEGWPIDVGVMLRHLNFIGSAPLVGPLFPGSQRQASAPDPDVLVWRVKPGTCYQAATSLLSPGVDTTLWLQQVQPFPTPPLDLAQSDDVIPGSEDTSSAIRYCAKVDAFWAATVHNYGYQLSDQVGKEYSFAVVISPPSPTPFPTPRPTVVPSTGGGGGGGGGGGTQVARGASPSDMAMATQVAQQGQLLANVLTVQARSSLPQSTLPPTGVSVRPNATMSAVPTGAVGVGLGVTATPTASPGASLTPTASPSAIPIAEADLVAYIDYNQNNEPDPGEGISGLRLILIDKIRNVVLQQTLSDENGHLHIAWSTARPIRLALPDLRYSHEIGAGELTRLPGEPLTSGGHWIETIRVTAQSLPGILP